MNSLSSTNFFHPTVLLAIALMAVISMMILPMPAWVLDIGLAISFSLAILMFTITLFIERPLDFSAFPTVLLASLMLRLSLNVSSTKLIISQGHTGTDAAGNVIEGFANFIMGGSVLLGLVVFCVLLIVNFVVITKGATRMAEVGARFALDAMPGKQMAIDADMAAGGLSHEEAKARRELEQAETTFFGSLDGASKFVKGDAIAGLLITLLNLIVGLCVGILAQGMPIGSAFSTYAILTVGDGLVSQIPAVVISIASALLLARGGANGSADSAIFQQMGKHPKALGTVATLMFLFALVPGLPFLPFSLGAIVLGVSAYLISKRTRAKEAQATHEIEEEEALPTPTSLGDMLDVDDIHLEFAQDLVSLVLDPATGMDARITNMRRHVAQNFGVILPEVRLTDNVSLPRNTYVIRIQGAETARGTLRGDKVLALLSDDLLDMPPGEDIREPVYQAPARWIDTEDQDSAALAGATTVTPAEVLATHLLEIIKRNLARLFTLKTLRRTLDEMVNLSDPARNDSNRRLIDELVPDKVPIDLLQAVLKGLLEEQVSIRSLPLILEAVAEMRPLTNRNEEIIEGVRQRVGFQMVAALKREDGSLPLIGLAPEWEERFAQHAVDGDRSGLDIALPPELFQKLSGSLAQATGDTAKAGVLAAIVTSGRRRRFLRAVVHANGISNPVFSFEEIGTEAQPAIVGEVAA